MPFPVWLRRALGVITLGGAATGFVVVLSNLFTTMQFTAVFVMLVFLTMYAFGAWCGMLMLENQADALPASALYWTLQVPVVSTDAVGYVFFSGFHVTVRLMFPEAMKVDFLVGSMFKFTAMQAQENHYIGVNLFALVCLILVWRAATRMRARAFESSAVPG